MARLLWLPDELARWLNPAGFSVESVAGWQTRGEGFPLPPLVVVAHHTATPASRTGDYPSLPIVRDGRSDLPGPLSQVGLGRTGRVYVIAAGKANHAGKGQWSGVDQSVRTIGIEAESPGDGTWTAAQRRAYPLVCAALLTGLKQPSTRLCAHHEWALPAGRKVDPKGWDMPTMRREVADLLKRGGVSAQSSSSPKPVPKEPTTMDAPPSQKRGDTGAYVKRGQALLAALFGQDIAADGSFGPRTEAACRNVQKLAGIPVTGRLDYPLWHVLVLARKPPSGASA